MKKKIRKNLDDHKFIYISLFLVLLLFTSGFFYNRYAVDTYYLEGYGYWNNALTPYFNDGRLFMTIFLGILGKLHVSFAICKMLSWMIAFCSLYCSILIFYHLFLKQKNHSKAFSAFISFFFVMNVFLVEFFMFPEYTGVMCFSILLISMASYLLTSYFKSRDIKYIGFACLFSFFTAFCYQGTLSLLVLFPIVFTFYYGRDVKRFIQNNLAIAFCYFIPSVTTLILSKLLKSSRTFHGFHLSLAFQKIYDGSKNLLGTTFGILPDYMFIVFTLLFSILIIYLFIRQKQKIGLYLFFVYIMAAVIIVTFIPHLLVDANSIWLVPRSNIGIGLLIVMPFVIYFLYMGESKTIQTVFVAMFMILAIFQFQGWQKLLFDQIKVNAFDRSEAMEVASRIREQEDLGHPIERIAVFNRQDVKYQYDGTHAYGDMNIRAMATDWTASSIITFYFGRELKKVSFPEKMEKLCSADQLREENKVFFQNKTVYVCTY